MMLASDWCKNPSALELTPGSIDHVVADIPDAEKEFTRAAR
jgi:hypothetical protein